MLRWIHEAGGGESCALFGVNSTPLKEVKGLIDSVSRMQIMNDIGSSSLMRGLTVRTCWH